ncbi:MAG TPA: YgiQ family radical SAM protein [Candidatus Hydrogenedentes bacterium]|nr:YgiQ family radical SAM protein [Candidatus Hydrogenedentota bacterium]
MNHTAIDAASPLPMTRAEMNGIGWSELDILLVTGDAYVDHPAFGAALLGRWLADHGYRVGIVAQPRWDSPEDIARMGRPRLFAGVAAGALDSMLAHYTAFRKLRRDDAYTPGDRHGARPNRASMVYANLVRHAFPGLPVVIGGIEASLRRATHYDFWSDKLRRSILLDSKADLVVYGMGERAILEIARRIESAAGRPLDALCGVPGTVFVPPRGYVAPPETEDLPSHEEIVANPEALMPATLAIEQQVHHGGPWLAQESGGRRVYFAPPAAPLTQEMLDRLYGLPFTRKPHPAYTERIPAVEMIQFSVTTHRGCGGGCSFCSLAMHQGRHIASRSAKSIEDEICALTRHSDWKGSLSDIGGPSANMWASRCTADPRNCGRGSCLTPEICPSFRDGQGELARLLQRISAVPGMGHVRVASGVRYDLALQNPAYVRDLASNFVGGQLKLAPEHCAPSVLDLMRKPRFTVFERFLSVFEEQSQRAGKRQYIVPYLMSAFPGCTEDDMRALADWLRSMNWRPKQVQCFVPTPGSVATAMYVAGKDVAGRPIHVARTDAERLRQHRILLGEERGGCA